MSGISLIRLRHLQIAPGMYKAQRCPAAVYEGIKCISSTNGYLRNTKYKFKPLFARAAALPLSEETLWWWISMMVDLRLRFWDGRIEGGLVGVGGHYAAFRYSLLLLAHSAIARHYGASRYGIIRQGVGEGRFFACRTICRSASRNKANAKCVLPALHPTTTAAG